ncbi:hypothetical protein DNTS_001259 [Danionella cerebrum]|uniref:Immunoglobulin domain-containing protein n=1 Tax=Danionella cerebrum TaxID=2873325 RepID=A0A553MZU7_9TELE|nr:hypothetical protein DNTS_001259 [Danionella translucida]
MGKPLCVVILFVWRAYELHGIFSQPEMVLSADEGDVVEFSCIPPRNHLNSMMWYKQVIGEEPRLIASAMHYTTESIFHNGFSSERFKVSKEVDKFNLQILYTLQSDAATYYCAYSFTNMVSLGNGTHLIVKGATKPIDLHEIKPVQCSVQTHPSRGDYRFHAFTYGSEASPGVIFIHPNTNDSCMNRSDPNCSLPTCIYKLPQSSSVDGLSECALAACGKALFGNAPQHKSGDAENKPSKTLLIIYISTSLLAISLTVNILLCYMRKKAKRGSQEIQNSNVDESLNQNQELTYSTVKSFTKHPREKRMSEQEDTVYSGLVF